MQNNIQLPPNLHLYVWLFSEEVEYHLTSEGIYCILSSGCKYGHMNWRISANEERGFR